MNEQEILLREPHLLQGILCGNKRLITNISTTGALICDQNVFLSNQDEIIEKEKELAILFLNIRHFTDLLETFPAGDILRLIGRVFAVFNKIISSYKGQVIEKNGDNLYAVFGLTGSLSDAANNAYQAARKMFQALDLLNDNFFANNYGYPLEIGMGMHTGHVYIGEFGFDTHRSTTVMGLPVNIASRLQTETKTQNNDMIISEEAYQLLKIEKNHVQELVKLRGVSNLQEIRLAGKAFLHETISDVSLMKESWLLAISG